MNTTTQNPRDILIADSLRLFPERIAEILAADFDPARDLLVFAIGSEPTRTTRDHAARQTRAGGPFQDEAFAQTIESHATPATCVASALCIGVKREGDGFGNEVSLADIPKSAVVVSA